MDAVLGVGVAPEAENESVGIVDRLVGCLQPVLTILGKAAPKQQKPGMIHILHLCGGPQFCLCLLLKLLFVAHPWK